MAIAITSLIISSSAIVISIFVYFQTKKYHKQKVLINKIERIFILIEDLSSSYSKFLNLTHTLDIYRDDSLDKPGKEKVYKEYKAELDELLEWMNIFIIVEKVHELEILARAYLSKKTQLKVISLDWLMRDIISYTTQMQFLSKDANWKEGFPSIDTLNKWVDELGEQLLDEIGFIKGIKNFRKEVRDYTEHVFKNAIGLKK